MNNPDDYRESPVDGVSIIIEARDRDLGDFKVRRFLPHVKHRKVGPFVFFDHMGPAEFAPGKGIDVRPHPHVCLATITFLYEGGIMHRDSLGYAQEILPGEVNWMTAGKGIVHSERTGDKKRAAGHRLHGLQVWVALPEEYEEIEPEFFHYSAEEIPVVESQGVTLTIISGQAYGKQSPVKTYSPLFYVNAQMPVSTRVQVTDEYVERAVYVVSGEVTISNEILNPGTMAVMEPASDVNIEATKDSELVLFGGAPITDRFLEWNFVASSRDRIEKAKDDWRNGLYAKIPDDDEEFIPLP